MLEKVTWMIQVHHLYKSFGRDTHALIDVTLQVNPQEFVFLCGPSGAGKTTLLRVLYRAERPDHGRVLVNGQNLTDLSSSEVPRFRWDLGIVFQDGKLLPTRTIFENLALAQRVRGVPGGEVESNVAECLEAVGLGNRGSWFPAHLSGGEQQRAAIARALVNKPKLLIADEPTGNLDEASSVELMALFENIHRDGATVLVATHDRMLVERMGYRVISLRQGRVVEVG